MLDQKAQLLDKTKSLCEPVGDTTIEKVAITTPSGSQFSGNIYRD
jgi:hypothetical protein